MWGSTVTVNAWGDTCSMKAVWWEEGWEADCLLREQWWGWPGEAMAHCSDLGGCCAWWSYGSSITSSSERRLIFCVTVWGSDLGGQPVTWEAVPETVVITAWGDHSVYFIMQWGWWLLGDLFWRADLIYDLLYIYIYMQWWKEWGWTYARSESEERWPGQWRPEGRLVVRLCSSGWVVMGEGQYSIPVQWEACAVDMTENGQREGSLYICLSEVCIWWLC